MHLKHACLPISPPEQGVKTLHIISQSPTPRKGVKFEDKWFPEKGDLTCKS